MALLDPFKLRAVTLRNRVVFGPHDTNLGWDRSLSERHVAYYRRRATGGAGMVVTETASVHESDWPYERAPLAADCGPGWEAITQSCHDLGAVVVASLGHAGGQGASAYSQSALWAPSGVPEVNTREVPKVMEPEDIAAVIEGFAAATRTALGAGVDGVEVNAGQHSLVRQFLSGLTNTRDDDYGADRLLFAREVLAAVRDSAGGGVVGLRLSCDELAPWAGITPDDAPAIAVALSEWVDYVTVVRGAIFSVAATRPDGHTAPGFNLELAAAVRTALDPSAAVTAQGSIVDVEMAEKALATGRCDLVEMTRAQIADPDLANKAAGDSALIRPCILCNQMCQVRDNRNPIVSCVGEPASGHETEDEPVGGHPPLSRDVLVVGGGPAGLETARVAALRGHRVRLVERSGRLGGMLRVASAGAGRERLVRLAGWLEVEVRRLGVDVVLDHAAGVEEIAEAPGDVVLCTGSLPGRRGYEVTDGADVHTAAGVLAPVADGTDPDLPEGPVVVWDPIGGPIGVSVAELLAAAGTQVTFVVPDFIVGTGLSRSGDLADANARLLQAGVTLVKRAVLRTVQPGRVTVEDTVTGERTEIEGRLLVDAGHGLPDDALFLATGGRHEQAGDSVAPRTVHEAILEGRRVALGIGR